MIDKLSSEIVTPKQVNGTEIIYVEIIEISTMKIYLRMTQSYILFLCITPTFQGKHTGDDPLNSLVLLSWILLLLRLFLNARHFLCADGSKHSE